MSTWMAGQTLEHWCLSGDTGRVPGGQTHGDPDLPCQPVLYNSAVLNGRLAGLAVWLPETEIIRSRNGGGKDGLIIWSANKCLLKEKQVQYMYRPIFTVKYSQVTVEGTLNLQTYSTPKVDSMSQRITDTIFLNFCYAKCVLVWCL